MNTYKANQQLSIFKPMPDILFKSCVRFRLATTQLAYDSARYGLGFDQAVDSNYKLIKTDVGERMGGVTWAI